MSQRLQRSTPEAQGIASGIVQGFVETARDTIQEFHSLMLVRHGKVIAEGWWSPYSEDKPHVMFSLSKSFTSSAIGIAVAENHLTLDDPVISFFADDLPADISDNLAAMKVRHLLSMSTGHIIDTTPMMVMRPDGQWIKAFLEQPVEREPGTHFLYNTGATYMLSAILQKVTGTRLLDYLEPRLMQPLGIENARWELSPEGIHTGGFGLNITTEDIAVFGQLYLQNGIWNGQRILTEAWINEATSKQISNGTNPLSDWEQGYGFQFWRCQHNIYRGDGAFGQYCIVMPEQDTVIAITSAVRDMQEVLNLVWNQLLPALANSQPLPPDPAAHAQLIETLSALTLPPPEAATAVPALDISGKTYSLESNDLALQSVAFNSVQNETDITFTSLFGTHTIHCGNGEWHEGTTALFAPPYDPVPTTFLASAVWTASDTLTLSLRLPLTPFFYVIHFRFVGDQLFMQSNANVGFGPTEFTLAGRETVSA